ncbi:hypothetical protein BG005_008268 [Podila minutissima]|nr:hypothetical protein BG005_008268 [Podila minutissima]
MQVAEPKEDQAQTLPKSTTGSPSSLSSSMGMTAPGPSSSHVSAPLNTFGPTLAPLTPTYGAPPTTPPRKFIPGELPNNLDASPAVDLRDLPIADWCTPDSEFRSPQDLPYAEAHSHNWSMDEQWMHTRWHPKRYLRSQAPDGKDVMISIPICNTTARLVDMMPCKEYEEMGLFVPMPRHKYRSSKEQSRGFGSGSGSAGGCGSNATASSSSSTSFQVSETPVQKLGQEKPKEKKKGSSPEEDNEVIVISDESDAEDQIPATEAKEGPHKMHQATTTKSSNNDTSTVQAGKAWAQEPLSSSSTSRSPWEESLIGDKSDQEITSKPASHKEKRKAIQAEKRALKVSKDKHSPSTEKEEREEREERKQECLGEGGGTSGAAPRQSRHDPQDEAVGARLRSSRGTAKKPKRLQL